jgi:hypothetical protein
VNTLKWFSADFHIHTVLSACAELSMGASEIVEHALKQQLDIIAITDHNSAENVPAVMQVAKNTPLTVIPGMEVCSKDDIHLVCLFPELEDVFTFQAFVYKKLQTGTFDEDMYGQQLVINRHADIVSKCSKVLVLGIDANVRQIATQVHLNNGIIYPAHIDRAANSIFRVYESVSRTKLFIAAEISRRTEERYARRQFPDIAEFPLITASDAHDVRDIGKARTYLNMKEKSFYEIKNAIQSIGGRSISLTDPMIAIENKSTN